MMHGRKKSDFASVIDRVVQQALVQKMTPIFEPLFADCSFGYRPDRSRDIRCCLKQQPKLFLGVATDDH